MKRLLIGLVCFFCIASLHAQVDSLIYRYHNYYGQLSTTDMSTNVLIDRAPAFSDISYFDGVVDTPSTQDQWWQMYL